MDGFPLDPVVARAKETGQIHAIGCGGGKPLRVAVWADVENVKRWLRRALEAAASAEPAASSSSEWLLDNAFQVQRAVLLVKEDMPSGFYLRLRPLREGPAKGEPCVLAMAHDLLHATHFKLSRQGVLAYLEGYQEHHPLDIAELWALPVMLRLACLERLVSGFGALFEEVPAPFAPSAACRQFLEDIEPAECVSRGVANLGVISSIAWKDVFDACCLVERSLARDPCGTYPAMDFDTRDAYRRAVERLATCCGHNEVTVANHAVALAEGNEAAPANHVGHWLVGAGLAGLEARIGARAPPAVRLLRLVLRHPGAVYTIGLFLIGLAGLVLPAAYLAWTEATPLEWLLGISLTALPATVIAVTIVNWLVTISVPPRPLPKLDFEKAIHPDWPTLVVMPVIVGSVEEVPSLISRLEAHRLSNPVAHGFVLLSDLCDAGEERIAADDAVEKALCEGVEGLNRRYGKGAGNGPFTLLHRARRFNPAQGCWMAWERKRGKLEEFNHFLLTGDVSQFSVTTGQLKRLPRARFVVTADADTRLPPGSVARLAATLAHPLNRPVFDAAGRVTAGYTVLQPRVEIAPHGSDSLFARLFGGDTAIDIYSRAVSDVYQDLVGTGNYVGKGIYDVASFARSLEGRVPENNLLSHDLWEGLHGRAGLASDIIVYESFPTSYAEYARRWHRWVRGDWQLLPWLWPRVPGENGARLKNRLSLFDRMRIWDTLRRSLVPTSVLALLLGGWFVLPGHPLIWTLLALLAPGAWLFTDVVTGLARGRRRGVLTGTFSQVGEHIGRWAMSVAFLVSDSWIALQAIGTTLLRLRKGSGLLEWTSAEHVSQAMRDGNPRRAQWRSMWLSPLTAVALVPPLAMRPEALAVAAPLLLVWLIAPEIAWLTGRPKVHAKQVLDDEACTFLRLVARRSWLYFENHVRPEDNWLPPDNHQEEPIEATAHRTSPTNIGMMVLAALSAWRMGHISAAELAVRMGEMFDSLDRLERWRGHILNWYDTGTLASLEPRYVSTVDSGNLAVSLVTLAKGCEHIVQRPAFDPERWQGFDDCLVLVAGAVEAAGIKGTAHFVMLISQLRADIHGAVTDAAGWPMLLDRCDTRFGEIRLTLGALLESSPTAPPGSLRDLRNWLERSGHHLRSMRRDMETVLPWLSFMASPPPGCEDIAARFAVILEPAACLARCADMARKADGVRQEAEAELQDELSRQWLAAFATKIKDGLALWRQLDRRLKTIAKRAAAFADGMDFTPLYDRDERLFHIGYDLSANRIDQHHYDLLASEARLASFFAIAKHDVPTEHWFQLGRPVVKRRDELALISWNGSMFEYLMPSLFLRSDPGTLLGESDRSSVDIQRRYGAANCVPWGISESGFAATGPDGSWRYRAFGVPELGLRRGLAEDLVIAPYASALALALRPIDAVANLRALARLGALGRCGFHEALDFTGERRAEGQTFVLVRSYMAHHHGMSIAAIANALFDNMFVAWFHADPRVQTVELLLNERVPWELPPEIERMEPPAAPLAEGVVMPRPQPWEPQSAGPLPALHLLGNGRLATRIGADGCGESAWKGCALTRPGEAQGGNGQFLYLRDVDSGEEWSPAPAPLGGGDERRSRFHAHKAEFHARVGEISSTLEVLVAPAEDVEVRRLRLVNGSARERTIEVVSYAEIALAPAAEWLRHPAFARLFVTVQEHEELNALLFQRRPRDPSGTPLVMVQRLVGQDQSVHLTGLEAVRSATRLRHGSASDFPHFSSPPGVHSTYPLDPVCVLRAEVVLPAYGESELAVVTTVATTTDEALELARRYGSFGALDWAEQDAAARAARDLHGLGLASDRIAEAQLLYSALHQRPGPRHGDPGLASRDELWAIGISGDLPVLLVEIGNEFDGAALRFLLAVHRFWRWRGAPVDMALLHPGVPGYVEPLRDRLFDLLRDAGSTELLAERGGVHIFAAEQLDETRLAALHCAAAVTFSEQGGTIRSHIERQIPASVVSPPFVGSGRSASLPEPALASPSGLRFANGYGGFTAVGDYRIDLTPARQTPAPWANVLANETFGSVVTEAGLGFSYAGNAGENRLTPWHNDPLVDPQGEALYLRDEETGEVWTISPLPAGNGTGCAIEHRRGETVWTRDSEGLSQEMHCEVAVDDPVKIVRVKLTDRLGTHRRITATFFADWLLGAVTDEPGPFRRCWYRADLHALLAQNRWHRDFAGRTAFLAATHAPHSLTTSRREFLGPGLDWRQPHGLTVWDLGDRTANYGEDAAAGLQIHIDIPAGGTHEFAFILGQAEDEDEAATIVARWQNLAGIKAESPRVAQVWKERCGAVEVESPDPAFDLMVNRWLPYQGMSSRLFARAGFYQAGGAYGFRDQLQDVLAMLLADPGLARAQILRAATHQFEQGDVLHWWHPPSGRGVRTRYSDDLLWLPYTVAHYVMATGDRSLLDERAPFLQAVELRDEEHDRYAEFPRGEQGSVFEHCLRAFARAWRLGEHGLPLIGEGDWNDGMNRVGIGKKGESVWLGWFLATTVRAFSRMADSAGRPEFGKRWLARANSVVTAIDRHAWDGGWYVRAFDDLGRPWGSRVSGECQIDSLAQSWAVLAGSGDPKRAGRALDAAFEQLVRLDDRIVRLLDPPFAETPRDPGYIKAYPPGIRENGGQYSHAAAWLGIAAAMRGEGGRAKEVFDRLNPILHARNEAEVERYLIEPYVVAGDIAGEPPFTGRGGWSWYTGAAAWTWRLGVEHILGIELAEGHITLAPCLPPEWPGYSATVRRKGAGAIEITVGRNGKPGLRIDGADAVPAPVAFPGEGRVRKIDLTLAMETGASSDMAQQFGI